MRAATCGSRMSPRQARSSTGAIDAQTTFGTNGFRNTVPRFLPQAREANRALVDVLAGIAARLSATPAQLALGWPLARKPWIVSTPARPSCIAWRRTFAQPRSSFPPMT
jgi:aryl-alcohol dehydrogenase-like predicted oxidoreductase